jgi:LAO/AO transport system kinase
LEKRGLDKIIALIDEFHQTLEAAGELAAVRSRQARDWLWSETTASLIADLKDHPSIKTMISELEQAVADETLPPTVAAQQLIAHYKGLD